MGVGEGGRGSTGARPEVSSNRCCSGSGGGLGLRLVFDRCGDVLVLWVLCVIACAGERIRSRCLSFCWIGDCALVFGGLSACVLLRIIACSYDLIRGCVGGVRLHLSRRCSQ